MLQLSWCKEGGEHNQVPSVEFWCKSRSYATDIGEAASDLHQGISDQYLVFSTRFATLLLRAAEFQVAAVEC